MNRSSVSLWVYSYMVPILDKRIPGVVRPGWYRDGCLNSPLGKIFCKDAYAQSPDVLWNI